MVQDPSVRSARPHGCRDAVTEQGARASAPAHEGPAAGPQWSARLSVVRMLSAREADRSRPSRALTCSTIAP